MIESEEYSSLPKNGIYYTCKSFMAQAQKLHIYSAFENFTYLRNLYCKTLRIRNLQIP